MAPAVMDLGAPPLKGFNRLKGEKERAAAAPVAERHFFRGFE